MNPMSRPLLACPVVEQIVEGKIIKEALHQDDRPVLPDIALCLVNAIKPAPGGKGNFSGLVLEPANAPIAGRLPTNPIGRASAS